MRIALLSYHTSPLAMLGGKDAGGMNVFVRETARVLARRGHDVDVFVRSTSPQLLRIDPRIAPGARVVHVPAGPQSPVAKRDLPLHVAEYARWVRTFAEGEQLERSERPQPDAPYDAIHAHYWLSGLAAETLAGAWGVRFALTFHTLAAMKNAVAQRPEDRETDARVEAERRLCGTAGVLTAATRVEWDQLMTLYGADSAKLRIVPPGVDTALFHPVSQKYAKHVIGVPAHHRLILFAGRIEPLKGIDTLLHAIAELRTRHPDWDCRQMCVAIIGGDASESGIQNNPEMARLHALRDELDLTELITFLGAQDQDSLHFYFSAAECVVMPSHYESFGMVALEAMACGTPVIASDVGGLGQLVRDEETGLLFEARDASALAGELERLILDEAFRRRMGHRAECYAQDFSWDRIVGKLTSVYAELADG